MSDFFDSRFPDIQDLKGKARKRMPKFAFDYLEGGCNQEHGIARNQAALEDIRLQQQLLRTAGKPDLSCTVLGRTYSAPFGIAPVGLQGLMWPNSPEILARAAVDLNIPFVLSTVSSSSLERIAEVSQGRAWFQLYNPTDADIREDIFRRLEAAQYEVLVVTVDVPTFGFRPRDIRNGLSMPPRMTIKNVLQMLARPGWLSRTVLSGKPKMQTLLPYMSPTMSADDLADFMNKTVMGPVDVKGLRSLRDRWKGKLVIKGILCEQDAVDAASIGADAIIISNHGARQIDIVDAPVGALRNIARSLRGRTEVYMDSGIQSGPDIARALACGADFTFLGRAFVYGVCALGNHGGAHTINSLSMQLKQIMSQLRCSTPSDLANCLAHQ